MNTAGTVVQDILPLSSLDGSASPTIDEPACRRFEAAWKEGKPEPIEPFLPPASDPRYVSTTEELVLIELEFAWRFRSPGSDTVVGGLPELPRVEHYLARFPYLNRPDAVRRLLVQEYRVRHLYGDRPAAEEYCRRFPEVVVTGQELEGALKYTRAVLPAVSGYEVLEVLGRGGMGVVYRARHLKLNRPVALKTLWAGTQASAEELDRFRAEAEAAARLQHPNIVQVFEVGECEGRAFIALELVGGGSLKDRLAGTPQPPEKAAQLVETLAGAVQAAHEAGIVHRDLKPGNVLLTKDGTPKVADFGLAKRLEDANQQTATGAVLGTPSYMAPEQAAGKTRLIGPAADVWALGAILYEMLTGRPPFRGQSPWDTIEQVLHDDPVPPQHLQPKLSSDLASICLKCLEKEPAKRYAGAGALADDLRRFLDGRPVQARPIGPARRTLKWMKRHPAKAVAAALVLVALLTGAAGAAWHVHRLDAEVHEKERQREKSEENFRNAWNAVSRCFTLATQDASFQRPGMQEARQLLLRTALEYYEDFIQARADDPTLQADLAESYYRVGKINARLGQHNEAIQAFRKAGGVYETLARRDLEDNLIQSRLGWCYFGLGQAYKANEQWADAGEFYRKAQQRFGALKERHADPADFQLGLEAAQVDFAQIQVKTGQKAEALQSFLQSRDTLTKLVAQNPHVVEYRKFLGVVCHYIGQLQLVAGKSEQALGSLEQARKYLEQLPRASGVWDVTEYQRELAIVYGSIANLYFRKARWVDTLDAYRKQRDALVVLVRENPKVPVFRIDLGLCYSSIGTTLLRKADYAEAQRSFEEARRLQEDLVLRYPKLAYQRQQLGKTYNGTGAALQGVGKWAEARDCYQLALATQEKLTWEHPKVPEYQSELAITCMNLGTVLGKLGQEQKAGEFLTRARDLMEKLTTQDGDLPERGTNLALCLECLRNWHKGRKDLVAALKVQDQARAIREKLVQQQPDFAPYQANLLQTYRALAGLHKDTGDPAAARKVYLRAVAFQEDLAGKSPTAPPRLLALGNTYQALGNFEAQAGNRPQAMEEFGKAVRIMERVLAGDPKNAEARTALFGVYWDRAVIGSRAGCHADALRDWDRVLELAAPDKNGAPRVYRAATLARLRKHAEAVRVVSAAKPADKSFPGVACVGIARVYALAAAAARQDETLPPADRTSRGEEYARSAVEWLTAAQARGYYTDPALVADLNNDPEFACLHDRDDWKRLMTRLIEKKGK